MPRFVGLVDLISTLIKSEYDNGNQIFVYVIGREKTALIGALFAVFNHIDRVCKVFYVKEDEHRVLPMPKSSGAFRKRNIIFLIY